MSRRDSLIAGGAAALISAAAGAEADATASPDLQSANASLAALPQSERHAVPVIGGSLTATTAGRGDRTLVLLHKLGGWAAEWRWLAPLLVDRVRIVAIDLPGHGLSKMASEPPYIVTQPEMAAQVMAVLDHLGEDRVAIAGSSIGGCTAILCAAMWPERISHLITLGSVVGPGRGRDTLAESDATYVRNGQFAEDDTPLPRDPEEMRKRFGMEDSRHRDDMALSRATAGRWIQPCTRGVAVCDYITPMRRVAAPVLFTYGSSGNYGLFAERAEAEFAQVETRAFADTSAFPHQDNPNAVAAAILTFLDDA